MRFVPIKSVQQQADLSLHRVRQGFVVERTATLNRIRGLMAEFGHVLPNGAEQLRRQVPEFLDRLPPQVMRCVRDLLEHAEGLRCKVLEYEREIRLTVRHNELAGRAHTRPGIGPLTASALVATVGNGHDFKNGRQFAAWLGLVPRQYSTGGKTRLGLALQQRRGYHRACVAIAAKNARIAWALLAKEPAAA
jgi:transposase